MVGNKRQSATVPVNGRGMLRSLTEPRLGALAKDLVIHPELPQTTLANEYACRTVPEIQNTEDLANLGQLWADSSKKCSFKGFRCPRHRIDPCSILFKGTKRSKH